MPTSHLNVAGGKSTFAHSQDFLNLDEAPKAKETPNVSQFNLTDSALKGTDLNTDVPSIPRGPPNYNYSNASRYNYQGGAAAFSDSDATATARPGGGSFSRRRSTNYIDALNNKIERRRSVEDRNLSPYELRRKSSSPGMDFQDSKHDMEVRDIKNEDKNNYHGVDMGDSFVKTKGSKDIPPPIFKDSYMQEGNTFSGGDERPSIVNPANADYYRTSFSSKGEGKPDLTHRKSSFAYEDFKKDIYDRLNMFEKK